MEENSFIPIHLFLLLVTWLRVNTPSFAVYENKEGIIKATGKNLPVQPSYSQIRRRLNKLDITSSRMDDDDDDDENIVIAIDSTGIKVTNRGQRMQEKWQVKKKAYLKIHIAVYVNTKEILALEVTDEKVHDAKVMSKLIEHILKRNNKDIKIELTLGGGSYDSNENFKYLQKKRIRSAIKVRKNSIMSSKNNNVRNSEVKFQTRDVLKWKKKRKYGSRWIAETVFSSIKRTFGEYVYAIKYQNMIKEMILKVSLYNLFRRMV